MPASVAVLGAAGFVGGAVARRAEASGLEVSRWTRQRPFLVDGAPAPGLASTGTVFWLVSSIRPAVAADERAQADLRLLRRLLDGLDAAGSDARVVVLSSGGTVYDTAETPPYTEQHPVRAANAYGEAMLEVEATLRGARDDSVVVRASNAYGPGQPARRGQGVVAHWLDCIAREEPIRLFGDPDVRRDYVYVDDLADALLAVAAHPDPPRTLNAGSGTGTSLQELADVVVRAVDAPVEMEHSPGRAFDAPSTWLSVDLAREALGWTPTTPLDEGVRRSWESLSG